MKKFFDKAWIVALFVFVLSGVGMAAYNAPWVKTQALYLNDVLVTSTAAELNVLDTAAAGSVVASKVAIYDAAGKLYMSSASPVAVGASVADAVALTAQYNTVTGANDAKGVLLPIAAADETVVVVNTNATYSLLVYAITGSQINALGSTVAYTVTPGQTATFVGRSSTLWYTAAASDTITGLTATAAELNLLDTTVAGTAVASKALALGANKNIDTLVIADGGLYLGATAGTSVSSTAVELNILDGATAIVSEINSLDFGTKVTMGIDFNGDLLDGTTELLLGAGSGSGNAVALAAGEGGNVSITTSSAHASTAADGSGIGGSNLNWRADSGGLVAECLLQIDDITDAMIFFGFTDVIASTVEAPLFLNAGDFESDADNACGIVYDTDGTTEEWCHGGVKATTDTVPAFSGTAPVNGTDVTLRVEVSVAGAVTGYINGVAIGTEVADAVTATTPLLPILFVTNRGGAARVVLADYIFVQANRR